MCKERWEEVSHRQIPGEDGFKFGLETKRNRD